MARVKGAMMTRKRRNKTLKLAKGYFGAKSKHFKMAKQAVMKSGQYADIGRKQKKTWLYDRPKYKWDPVARIILVALMIITIVWRVL